MQNYYYIKDFSYYNSFVLPIAAIEKNDKSSKEENFIIQKM